MKLNEQSYSESLKVDKEAGVIRGVKILGRQSKNGRLYSQRAMESAQRLYDGVVVHIDHPDNPRKHRGMQEGFGVIKNPTIGADGVYGDLHYIKAHSQSGPMAEWAERFPDKFGLSHVAEGKVTPGGKGNPDLVDEINSVESVDIVRRPATNRGLFESERTEPMPKKLKVILDEHKKNAEAKRLLTLLEEAEFAGCAEIDVEIVEGATDADQIVACRHAISGKLLEAATTKKQSPQKPSEAKSDNAELAKLQEQLAVRDRRDRMRDLLEAKGLAWAKLTETQQKLLEGQPSDELLEALIETFPVSEAELLPTRGKPAITSKANQRDQASKDSYDKLSEEVARERKRSGRRPSTQSV